MSFTYDIEADEEDEEYPDYAKKRTFSMPTPGNSKSVIIARRDHQGGSREVRGWLLHYVGDDPESSWTLYKPGYCLDIPWDHNPEADPAGNVPDAENGIEDLSWQEPTAAVQRFMKKHHVLLLDDERIVRTIERYRR